jgi:hypothetical protein
MFARLQNGIEEGRMPLGVRRSVSTPTRPGAFFLTIETDNLGGLKAAKKEKGPGCPRPTKEFQSIQLQKSLACGHRPTSTRDRISHNLQCANLLATCKQLLLMAEWTEYINRYADRCIRISFYIDEWIVAVRLVGHRPRRPFHQ